jgi:hypothetical protein
MIISCNDHRVIIFVYNLSLRFISRFGRFHDDFNSARLSLSLSLWPLYPFDLSIPFTSLSLSLSPSLYPSLSLSYLSLPLSLSYLSLPLYIFPSTFLSLTFLLSLFSLSFSLAYLMDVFVLVYIQIRIRFDLANSLNVDSRKKFLSLNTFLPYMYV